MTNTKFRRRALLSSVAMLLVALVALGSATFAWFSQNSKATAEGIGAKTQQGSNILVSETGAANSWNNRIQFATKAGSFYTPVTPNNTLNSTPVWKTTTSDGVDLGIKGSADYTTPTANTDYTATKLYVKYDAASTEKKSVNISFSYAGTTAGTEDFLRVALVPANSTTKAVFGDDAVIYGTDNDDFAKDESKFTSLTATNTNGEYSIVTTTSKSLYSAKELKGGAEYQFNVFVWFEGTDPECIDSNANTNFVVDFAVEAAA